MAPASARATVSIWLADAAALVPVFAEPIAVKRARWISRGRYAFGDNAARLGRGRAYGISGSHDRNLQADVDAVKERTGKPRAG